MKKIVVGSFALVGAYATFLKASEIMQRKAIWQQVTDPVK